jgi:beta-phosphoglucomutase-like phosphatase (HAD superfamily)
MSPVTYGPSDINNPRGYPFVGPVPESFWLTKALVFDLDWILREVKNPSYDRKDYPEATPQEAVKHCLRALRSYEIRLSLISNQKNAEVVPEVARLNLAEDFDNIRCFEDVKELRPAPELHLLSLDMMGVKPWKAVAFETSPEGVEAAERAGIFCVGMPPSVDGKADMTLGSFLGEPLLRLLERIDQAKRVKYRIL